MLKNVSVHMKPQKAQSQPGWNPAAAARAQLRQLAGSPWEEAFPAHVATLAALAVDKPGEAYTQLIASVQPFIKVPLALGMQCAFYSFMCAQREVLVHFCPMCFETHTCLEEKCE